MSYVTNPLTAEAIRTRLQAIRTFHCAALRTADDRLHAAMAEYEQSLCAGQEPCAGREQQAA